MTATPPPTPRADRLSAIQGLEAVRNSTVITYVTSTKANIGISMAMDAIPVVYRHLQALPEDPDRQIDLFLHSNGGDGVVPWRLVTLLREYCAKLCVLVPSHAFSAATLTSLGADEVVMHPMGMLGPTDPTVANAFNPKDPAGNVLGISVEDVTSYISLVKDDVGIHHEDELVQAFGAMAAQVHPLALGNVKRSTSQSRMMGEKLLRTRKGAEEITEHDMTEVIDKLTSQLFYHGHPINRQEARDALGLTWVKDATPDEEAAMWALFERYSEHMDLDRPFQPIEQAIALTGGVPTRPGAADPPTTVDSTLPPLKGVYVESAARCDVQEVDFEVTLRRDFIGNLEANIVQTRAEWATE